MGEVTLITGGARSGKSRFAETLAAEGGGRVVYLATLEPRDDEMRLRVARHRASRPASWLTVEEPLDPLAALQRQVPHETCLLDCLTLWLSNLLLQTESPEAGTEALEDPTPLTSAILGRVRALLEWQQSQPSHLIIVTNEVGSGLVPEYELSRTYRDLLGEANQIAGAAADRLYLCVAGQAVDLKTIARSTSGPGE
jgi:adenosylcobinamide kinase/adenosylcobinamide-phosphate guanylyltransferase